MSQVIEKVRGLIALSASCEEEEARTAAALACRLIREHGLVVGAGAAAPASGGDRGARPDHSSDFFSCWARAERETDRAILVVSDEIPMNTQYGDRSAWVPKSMIVGSSEVCRDGDVGWLVVKVWFARKAGWV